jgi:hypothetical protein
MAWNRAIKAEWDEHQSLFATQWLVTMVNLQKLWHVKDERLEELRKAIEGHSVDQNVTAVVLKDCHLVEAALVTDRRIASLDEQLRGHLTDLAAAVQALRPILWVNPAIAEEGAVEWLEKGAPSERRRRLRRK